MSKWILGLILTFLLAGGATGYLVIEDTDTGEDGDGDRFESSLHQVQYVVDGDTLDVEHDVRVRLIGIDTPERTECGYQAAREFLVQLVAGKSVRMEKDVSETDDYDRLLRYIYLPSDTSPAEDSLVNESILRAGYARTMSIPPDNRYWELFAAAQDEAKRAGRGIWSLCENSQTASAQPAQPADSQLADPACVDRSEACAKTVSI